MAAKAAPILLPLALLLCQCGPGPGPAKGEHGDRVDLVAPPPPPPMADTPYAFDIALTLTPAAKTKLERLHEKIGVSAWYSGLPNAAGKPKAEEDGQVEFGADEPVLEPDTSLVHIPGGGLDTSRLKYIKGDPLVLINVYSARKAAADNLLECTIFEDTIRKAQTAPVAIGCKLIEPDREQGGAQ